MKSFSAILEELREARQISKKDLAARTRLSTAYISLLTSGDRKAPSEVTVKALADALELDTTNRSLLFAAAGYSENFTSSVKIDWGEFPNVEVFYGRESELLELEQWIVGDRCQLASVLGIGGIGKSVLSAKLVDRVKYTFEYVYWRSLHNAPPLENILKSAIQFFSDQQRTNLPDNIEDLLSILIEYLRTHRCLMVLDNFESVLKPGSQAGQYLENYKGYGNLLQHIGAIKHQSCLLLTSREKPNEIPPLEGRSMPVRSMHLTGVKVGEARQILKDEGLEGSDEAWQQFVDLCVGNPFALKLASELIRELFMGEIATFLREKEIAIDNISILLDQQFQRLSSLEQTIMFWLAIDREAVSLYELRDDIIPPISKSDLTEALKSLRHRLMIETSGSALFRLQPIIMEYVTGLLVQNIFEELENEDLRLFANHALIKAQAKDYIRQAQILLILEPITHRLLTVFGREGLEAKLKNILCKVQELPSSKSSYAGGNLLNLLVHRHYDINGYDLSSLAIWQAYLQDVTLTDVNFANTDLTGSVFADKFGSIFSVTFSSHGDLLAAGTANGEIRLWLTARNTPLHTCMGHTDSVRSVAFNPNNRMLASGSDDQTIRLWEVDIDRAPVNLKILADHTGRVYSVIFSPDGKTIASGSEDQTIRLWDIDTGKILQTLRGHDGRVWSVAFSPDGKTIASGSEDRTARLWDIDTGGCYSVLRDHTDRVYSVAFSANGEMLASGSHDKTIRLWETSGNYRCLKILEDHNNWIRSVAFFPNTEVGQLASGSDDQTVRLWDIKSGECLKTLQGKSNWVRSIAYSSDGKFLISGSEDRTVRLWDATSGKCLKVLSGHDNRVRSVAFSPDGKMLASSSEDRTVRLWDATSGKCLNILPGFYHWVWSVTFSPDSKFLASAGEDHIVRIWEVNTGECILTLKGHEDWIWSVAYSPDGKAIASGSDDQTIRLWNVNTGECLFILEGHKHRVRSVAFSPSGKFLASGSEDRTIRLWETSTGNWLKTLQGHSGSVYSVGFDPSEENVLASGSEDETIMRWDIAMGKPSLLLKSDKPYERMNIAGVTGLTMSQKAALLALGAIED
jgi:WD40 repeat protein/transcriptional regulator with XRE-family HTH domain